VRTVLQVFLADEDDAGDTIGLVALEPYEKIGRRNLEERLAAYLAEVDQLCEERSLSLSQPAEPAAPNDDEGGS
jgi:hypothetical protein